MKSTMFLTTCTSVMLAVVLSAVINVEAGCPEEILCKNDEVPCEYGYETQSYVIAEDGEECPACVHCLPDDEHCPDMPCPSVLDAPEECVDMLYVRVAGEECMACDVATCIQPTIPIY